MATDDLTTTTGEVTTTEESTTTAETTTSTIDELTTISTTTETTILVVDETTTTTADFTTDELETLTTDEVSTSLADTTTSIQIESSTSIDAETVLSTASEITSTSFDQGPVLVSDTTTSESIVSTTEELIESTTTSTSVSSSVTPEVSSESTTSSIVSTALPPLSSTSTSFAEETSTSTSTSRAVPETKSTPVEPVTSTSPETPTTSSSDASPATSSPADGPSNIDTILGYTYKGCLGSADGYLSFNLVGSGANMTTASCVALARGRAYVGIYDRFCYASDSLDSTSLVLNGRCDIPCPGNSSHFCGGLVVSSSERRWVGPRKALDKRAAPANILLTLYALDDESPSPGETSTPVATVTDIVTESVVLQPVETIIDSVTQPGQTRVETMVTTVTYTIVDPNNPSTMTATKYCATLPYEPCSRCAHPPVPTVEMTTYVVPCNACGHHGENEVTITAPCAAVTEPVGKDTHRSEDLINAFAPTRAAYHAVPGYSNSHYGSQRL
ncbi:hypothetical protein Forpe1208_v015273 [Fusarium oxysporum f. sp. rapae]|uniref:WSC domain-containing protein n=1 Tax=Fusarium oxysporum f. sp. rapae TaxID=485398 RepID=A0A8J5TZ07_FUSOX|nr:hypothetical protein Forpe1208_v015273 [Fusarium oxysporum f. sp. rapae]